MLAALAAGCAREAGPPGGTQPELAAVPARAAPRYDPFERTVLRDALDAAATDARLARASVRARVDGGGPEPAPPLPPPPATPPDAAASMPAPGDGGLEDNLVTADSLLALAEAVGRDRLELARRARIREAAFEVEPPEPERIGVVAFAPSATTLSPRERERLARALAALPAATRADGPAWIVRTGGPLAAARAIAVVDALVAQGVPAEAIVTARLDRQVDVAEIAVRR